MGIKEFFRPTWPKLILFAVINLVAGIGTFGIGGIAGKHVGSGFFDIFSFFIQFKCAGETSIMCEIWDYFLTISVSALNLAWQYLLGCAVAYGWDKIRNKSK